MHPTKQLLLDTGLVMLLERGYNDLGIQALLSATGVPKGSFYHHFEDKEDFALAVVDLYMISVHEALETCLTDPSKAPLERVRSFFEATRQSYKAQGYMGCLLGGLGQELSGVSDVFRKKIASCFAVIAKHLAACLDEAVDCGELYAEANTKALANVLVDCWEGAALRSRLQGSARPLNAMLDFYFRSVPST